MCFYKLSTTPSTVNYEFYDGRAVCEKQFDASPWQQTEITHGNVYVYEYVVKYITSLGYVKLHVNETNGKTMETNGRFNYSDGILYSIPPITVCDIRRRRRRPCRSFGLGCPTCLDPRLWSSCSAISPCTPAWWSSGPSTSTAGRRVWPIWPFAPYSVRNSDRSCRWLAVTKRVNKFLVICNTENSKFPRLKQRSRKMFSNC